MWSSNQKRLTPNLKQLTLVPKAPELQPAQSPAASDPASTTESVGHPSTWRKELKLTRVVERERKKLSTATTSSSCTSTSYSSTSSAAPRTPSSDLPFLDDRLALLDEKLEVVENMFLARQQMFELLDKKSNLLNLDLRKEIQRHSQSYQSFEMATTNNTLRDVDEAPPAPESIAPTGDSKDQTHSAAPWGNYLKKLW